MSTPKEPRVLSHIPEEVLRQIASYLDRRSALALTRTCKALRGAGEMGVWRDVQIITKYDHAVDLGAMKLEDWRERHDCFHELLKARLAAMKAHPVRFTYVQHLMVEDYPNGGDLLLRRTKELLAATLPYVRDLSFKPQPFMLGAEPERGSIQHRGDKKYQVPTWVVNPWDELRKDGAAPRLRKLNIGLRLDTYSECLELFRQIGKTHPRLTHVELNSADGAHVDLGDSPRADKGILPYVTHLSIDDMTAMDQHSSCLLLRMLSMAPNVTHLTLSGFWQPFPDDIAFEALVRHTAFKRLVLLTNPLNGIRQIGTGWKSEIEELCFDQDGTYERQELHLGLYQMPRLQHLRHLCVFVLPGVSMQEFAELGIGAPAPVTYRISEAWLRRQARNPKLTVVQLVSVDQPGAGNRYNGSGTESQPWHVPNEWFIPPSEWERTGSRGLIIRTYKKMVATGPARLTHIRALSRVRQSTEPLRLWYVGARRTWTDLTCYMSRTVPRHVLVDVYAAAKMDIAWLEGGRDMELPREGWAVLDKWFLSLGPSQPGGRRNRAVSSADMDDDDNDDDSRSVATESDLALSDMYDDEDDSMFDDEDHVNPDDEWQDTEGEDDDDMHEGDSEDPLGSWN